MRAEAINWLCAAAAYMVGVGSSTSVVDASAEWLAVGPDSEALFNLAEIRDPSKALGVDVHEWIHQALAEAGWPEPSQEEWAWLATYCFLTHSPTAAPEVIARFLARLPRALPTEFELLSGFMADTDDLDDGLDPGPIHCKTLERYRAVRPELMATAPGGLVGYGVDVHSYVTTCGGDGK